MRKGYTLPELLIAIGIILILGLVSLAGFVNRRNESELDATASRMAALLREAQSRSVSQDSGASWGVRFDNGESGAGAYYALFSVPYTTSSLSGQYPLPAWVKYVTSSIAAGSHAEITFSQISGLAAGSSSIAIQLTQKPQSSSTISVASSGAVSY